MTDNPFEIPVPLKSVVVDGKAFLKMMTHILNSNFDGFGQLFGLEIDGILEVTDCVGTKDNSIEYAKKYREYCAINHFDSLPVGYYRGGPLYSIDIKNLLELHKSSDVAVCLLFDSKRALQRLNPLRAFYISPQLIMEKGAQLRKNEASFDPETLFVEIPVELSNSSLNQVALLQLFCDDDCVDPAVGITINTSASLDQAVCVLSDYIRTDRRFVHSCLDHPTKPALNSYSHCNELDSHLDRVMKDFSAEANHLSNVKEALESY
ncbi:hypothetical protein PCE1_002079 [Barthelona sp. PCE]